MEAVVHIMVTEFDCIKAEVAEFEHIEVIVAEYIIEFIAATRFTVIKVQLMEDKQQELTITVGQIVEVMVIVKLEASYMQEVWFKNCLMPIILV